MGFSPLAQAVIVAVLAYISGLLLGLSVRRGEIGRRRRALARRSRRAPAPTGSPWIDPPAPQPLAPPQPAAAPEPFVTRPPDRAFRPEEGRPFDATAGRRRSSRQGRRGGFLRNLRLGGVEISVTARRYAGMAILLVVLVALALSIVTLVLEIQSAPRVLAR